MNTIIFPTINKSLQLARIKMKASIWLVFLLMFSLILLGIMSFFIPTVEVFEQLRFISLLDGAVFCSIILILIFFTKINEAILTKTSFEIDERHIVLKSNFISTIVQEIKLVDIRDIELNKGFLQKKFNMGNIYLQTNAAMKMMLVDIKNPEEIYQLIKERLK